MTVSTELCSVSRLYTGQTEINCGFPVDQPEHLVVYAVALGVETRLTPGLHYTPAQDETSRIGLVLPIAGAIVNQSTLRITRETPALHEIDLDNSRTYDPKALEREFDRNALRDAELRRNLLPDASTRAGKVSAFDANGNPIAISPREAGAGMLTTDILDASPAGRQILTDGDVFYTRNNGLTRKPLRDLRRDWTTIDDQRLLSETTDDNAFLRAIKSGLLIDLEGTWRDVYLTQQVNIAPNGPTATPEHRRGGLRIVGNGRNRILYENDGNWPAFVLGTSGYDIGDDGFRLRWEGFNIVNWKDGAERPRPIITNSRTSNAGVSYVTTQYLGLGDTQRKWLYAPEIDGVSVQGFHGSGWYFDGLYEPRFNWIEALRCGMHGLHAQTPVRGIIRGRAVDIGARKVPLAPETGDQFYTVYPIALSRRLAYGNNVTGYTATLTDCPNGGGTTVTWHAENAPYYFAFDTHGVPNVTWRDCSCKNVAAAFNFEQSHIAGNGAGVHPHNQKILGGNFSGLEGYVYDGVTYRPGPAMFVDSYVPPGSSHSTSTDLLRNITVEGAYFRGFGHVGMTPAGLPAGEMPSCVGNRGAIIYLQGVESFVARNVEIMDGSGPTVLLAKPYPLYESQINRATFEDFRLTNPINTTGGGLWSTPCGFEFENANIRDININNFNGRAPSWFKLFNVSASLTTWQSDASVKIGAGTRIAGADQSIPALLRQVITGGSGSPQAPKVGGRVWISGASIDANNTRLFGATIVRTGVGTFQCSIPDGVFRDTFSMHLVEGSSGSLRGITLTVASTTSVIIQTSNNSGLIDPAVFDFAIGGW